MALFIVRRLISLVVVLFAITVLTFLIFFATPGVDPTRSLAGRNPTPETVAAVRHQFGLDRSKPAQYVLMMKRLFISPRPRLLRQPGAEGGAGDHRGDADDVLARDRRRGDLGRAQHR